MAILRPSVDEPPANLGRVPTIGGDLTTSIPDPVTGTSATQDAQGQTTAVQSIVNSIVIPPAPYQIINRLDPSGSLTIWFQTLIRKLGGYSATPVDDVLKQESQSYLFDQILDESSDNLLYENEAGLKGWVSGQGYNNELDFLLDNEPTKQALTYSTTWTANKVTKESWFIAGPTLLKSIDYTYSSDHVSTEVRKIFSGDGVKVIAQSTITYTFSSNHVISATYSRDI